MTKINRRQFLALTAAGAGSAIIASCGREQATYGQTPSNLAIDLAKLHQSQNGLLEIDLEASDTPQPLATVNYGSAVESLSIPTKLASISALPESQTVKRFELNHGMSPSMGMAFLINGEVYNHDRLNTQVKLNTIEDWEIANIKMMDHPFHVHNNAFQVVSRNGQPESLLAWRDTVLVKRGENVRIRIPFRDFAGKTVYHCHVLDREDLGMMGNLMIEAE